jgi:hypothetical protein
MPLTPFTPSYGCHGHSYMAIHLQLATRVIVYVIQVWMKGEKARDVTLPVRAGGYRAARALPSLIRPARRVGAEIGSARFVLAG